MKTLSKKTIKIISLYVIGLLLMMIYYQIDGSSQIADLLQKSEVRGADTYFGMHVFIGLIKYISILSGAAIIGITTLKLAQLNFSQHDKF